MPPQPPRLQTLSALLALAAWAWPGVGAAVECRWSVDRLRADGVPTTPHQLRVGEIARPRPMPLLRVHNLGPHDIRLSFDGAPPRVLHQGQAEPAQGALAAGVRLTQVECLATRALAAVAGPRTTTLRLAAARLIDEHRP